MKSIPMSIPARPLLAITIVLLGSTAPALAQLDISWFTVDSGGHTFSTGGVFRLGGTSGQPDAGNLSGGNFTLTGGFWRVGGTLSAVPEDPPGPDAPGETGLPLELRISAGLQNPFRHETGIRLELPSTLPVEIRVYDVSGRLIRRLHNSHLPPGIHDLAWDGRSDSGRRVASSVYLLRVRAGRQVKTSRVVLLR
ncbi:MAG: FlgD immunoglobulin-like domain containing protein [bacterium]